MEKILIIQTAFIGDVVLATNLIERIHASMPSAQIDFLVRGGNEGLLKGHPYLKNLLVWRKKEQKLRNLLGIIKQVRAQKYDRVVNVQRYFSTGLITIFSGAKQTIGFNKNPLSFLFHKKIKHVFGQESNGSFLHETERNLMLIEHFTKPIPVSMRLYPAPDDEAAVATYKKQPYICLAPSSVWFTKQYPVEKWVSFLAAVPNTLQVYLLGAPSDKALGEKIIAALPTKNIENLSGKLGFLASASLMRDAKMNFVNDSAPLHFTSATNAPVTAVFCSTIPAFGYGPLSANSRVVECAQKLPCRPCGLHGKKQCPEGHFKCALLIEDSQLLDRLLW